MDFEDTQQWDLTITASDGGGVRTVFVTVLVEPVNDNSPVFATANLAAITKAEDTVAGDLITTIVATDADVDTADTDHGTIIYNICNNLEAEGECLI